MALADDQLHRIEFDPLTAVHARNTQASSLQLRCYCRRDTTPLIALCRLEFLGNLLHCDGGNYAIIKVGSSDNKFG
ncbi:MAG: hypothetical protein ACUVVU_02305 [Tepidimonas sp.]